MVFDDSKLGLFLVEAKRNTYASEKGSVAPSRKGAKDLAYQKNGFSYVDSYFGEKDFAGEEVVYSMDIPIWSMNYYGRMLQDDVPVGFIETLREALLKVEVRAPYRGCGHLRRGDYDYYCHSEGNLRAFSGHEYIEYRQKEVYRLSFHGGQVR
jgi:hypothetical protein